MLNAITLQQAWSRHADATLIASDGGGNGGGIFRRGEPLAVDFSGAEPTSRNDSALVIADVPKDCAALPAPPPPAPLPAATTETALPRASVGAQETCRFDGNFDRKNGTAGNAWTSTGACSLFTPSASAKSYTNVATTHNGLRCEANFSAFAAAAGEQWALLAFRGQIAAPLTPSNQSVLACMLIRCAVTPGAGAAEGALCTYGNLAYSAKFGALSLLADAGLVDPAVRWMPMLAVGDGQVLGTEYLEVGRGGWMRTLKPLPAAASLWSFGFYGLND